MNKIKISIPEATAILSLILLLNPLITWPQVAALFLAYSLYSVSLVCNYYVTKNQTKESDRLEKLEKEVRELIQIQNLKNLR